MEKKKRKKTILSILAIVVLIAIALCLKTCISGCNANRNVAETIPTEPETVAPTIETEPSETVPEETNPAVTTPVTPSVTEPPTTQPQEIIPQESTPPVTDPVHTHNYSATNTVSPTCTAQGYTTFTCSCGSSYQDNVIQATGHSWGAWTTTKEATTSAAGEQIRTCSVCSATESQAIAQLPEETPTEPAVCQHSWNMNYYPEQGHYGEPYVMCICGYKCQTSEQWLAHVQSIGGEEAVLYHTSRSSGKDYIVDSPERYEWVCSQCGAISNTQP